MFDRTPPEPKIQDPARPGTAQAILKHGLLQGRLALEAEEARRLLVDLQLAVAQTLGIPDTAIKTDLDFNGGEMDFVFTIHRQNLPTKRRSGPGS